MNSTGNVHALTNLAAGHAIALHVPAGQEPSAAARSYLASSGLPDVVQRGFFVSVYPTINHEASSAALEDASQG
jgi:hypothetical protein